MPSDKNVLKVVLDTNQFVSSLISKRGASAQLVEAWRQRRFILISSNEIIGELRRILRYPQIMKKYHLHEEDAEAFVQLIEHEAVVLPLTRKVNVLKEDPDDNKILACAADAEAEYIVSGGRHLLNLGQYQNTLIVPVGEFLKLIRQE